MKKIFFLSLILSLFTIGSVLAAEPTVKVKDNAYSAKFVSQNEADPIVIEAGATKNIVIKFKNVGSINWDGSKSHFISAYTMEPRERKSVFFTSNWLSSNQTGKIGGVVKPGQTGELSINLKAPEKIGEYIEKFYLAAENYSWVQNGYFFLKIKVVPAKILVKKDSEAVVTTTPSNSATGYAINKQIWTKKTASGVGGEVIKVVMAWQNKGKNTWAKYQLTGSSNIYDSSWANKDTILSENQEVLAENFLRKEFYFKLPNKQGEYVAEFVLNIDEGKIKETMLVPLTVTADGTEVQTGEIENSVINNSGNQVINSLRLGEEPRMRVGLVAPESNFIQFRSYEDDYKVLSGGEEKGILPTRKFAVIKYEDGKYNFKGGDLEFISTNYIRLEPVNNPRAVFSVPNLIRTAKWVGPGVDFDTYRGAMEYRRGEVDEKLYVVNDLLLEDYVRGMAENSLSASQEFLKANLIAARTYAYVSRGKYPFFDVVGNTYDQLYLGVNAEKILTNVQEATTASQGMMVTYDGEVVVTPYFGNSSGTTKSWKSAWGGSNKPWLVPVICEYDKGKRMNGHGVGMSQLDAYNRAKTEGINFVELLKHYYTGVEIEKLY